MANPRHSEYLSEDLLDDSFVKCFSPILIPQRIFGCARVDMRDGFVTNYSTKYLIWKVLWFCLVSYSFYYFADIFYNTVYNAHLGLYIVMSFGLLSTYLSFAGSAIHSTCFDQNKYIELYIQLHKIDEACKIQHLLLNTQQFKIYTACVFVTLSTFLIGFSAYVIDSVGNPLQSFWLYVGMVTVYLDLLSTASMIHYLALRLQHLNQVANEMIIDKLIKTTIRNIDHNGVIETSSGIIVDFNISKLREFIHCVESIFKIFHKIVDAHSFTMFNVVSMTFIFTCIGIEALVMSQKSKVLSPIATIMFCLLIVFYISLLLGLAVVGDWFFKETKKLKLISITAQSLVHEGCVSREVNKVFKQIYFFNPNLSVYGIFILNKAFLLKLLGLITSNVLVLIQFTVMPQ